MLSCSEIVTWEGGPADLKSFGRWWVDSLHPRVAIPSFDLEIGVAGGMYPQPWPWHQMKPAPEFVVPCNRFHLAHPARRCLAIISPREGTYHDPKVVGCCKCIDFQYCCCCDTEAAIVAPIAVVHYASTY